MKKTASSLILMGALGLNAAAYGLALPPLTIDSKIGFESEYVNCGRKEGQECFQLAAETGSEFAGGHLYVGAQSAVMLGDAGKYGSSNSVSPYIGFRRDVLGWLNVDCGYEARLYTNLRPLAAAIQGAIVDAGGVSVVRNTNELYAGVSADVLLNPKAYLAYNFDREEFSIVGSIGYSYDLSGFSLGRFALEGKAHIGYDYAKRPFGIREFFGTDSNYAGKSKDYFYFGLGADLIYKYNEQANIRAGTRYEVNTASKTNWGNAIFGSGHKNLVWFTSAVEFSF
jgi:hypothetical protein